MTGVMRSCSGEWRWTTAILPWHKQVLLLTSYHLPCKYPPIGGTSRRHNQLLRTNYLFRKSVTFSCHRMRYPAMMANFPIEMSEKTGGREQKPRYKWLTIGPDLNEEQNDAFSRLPSRMSNRCRALMKQMIYFSPERGSLSGLLDTWVRKMKPLRADWLSVLKELKNSSHPFYIEVAEFALLDESFEPNIRDYTKVIHFYGKQKRVEDVERILIAMKNGGFVLDQVTLTTLVHIYSKANNLKMAEETFQEIKLLGHPLDRRSYGSMIMAYIRAGMPLRGENLLKEMDSLELYPGIEIYKALLRFYSMAGDAEGAQRVFDAIQIAGISPDVRICGLLINAYLMAGQSQKARTAFESMKLAGIKPDDKCVALVLAAYEKQDKLSDALDFLVELETDGISIGKEASTTLAAWFRKLGVIEEVEKVLTEFTLAGNARHCLTQC